MHFFSNYNKYNALPFFAVFFLVFSLAGCGGGGGSDPAPVADADVSGIYDGTFTQAGGGVYNLQGIIHDNRAMFILEDGFAMGNALIYDGTLTIDGKSFTSNFKEYNQGATTLTGSAFAITGSVNDNGVVAGNGSINQSGLTTNINQLTSSLAIDWSSYNINSNEIVNYIQPGSSSIVLNRILDSSASQIHGQINANGNVILVNTNGLFFSPTASINVGGLIASGLDVSPTDFMNGDYIFNEVLGTDGTVINSGLINASLGGNVALLGKQVINEGVISAKLGSVNLAAGKAAILTFDAQGLLGIKITKEILQDELGIDPAVLNSGEITAEGGRILLTASVSQDVFRRRLILVI